MKRPLKYKEHHIFDFDGTITTESGQELFSKVYSAYGSASDEAVCKYFNEVQSRKINTILSPGVQAFLVDLFARPDCKVTILSNNYVSYIKLVLQSKGFNMATANITIVGRDVTQGREAQAYGQYGNDNKGMYIIENICDADRYSFYDDSNSAVRGVDKCCLTMNMETYNFKPGQFEWDEIHQAFIERVEDKAGSFSELSSASLFAPAKTEGRAVSTSDSLSYQLIDDQGQASYYCPCPSTCMIL